jgi:hypothetical protein
MVLRGGLTFRQAKGSMQKSGEREKTKRKTNGNREARANCQMLHIHDDVDSPTSAGGMLAFGAGPLVPVPGTMLPALLRGTSWPVSATLAPRSTLPCLDALRLA